LSRPGTDSIFDFLSYGNESSLCIFRIQRICAPVPFQRYQYKVPFRSG
jgi:hypothetical protein